MIEESDDGKPRMELVPLQPGDRASHEKHVIDFIESVRTRKAPICEIEEGHNVALVAHMGNIAYRTGHQLRWDEPKGNFGNEGAANKLLKPEYRSPWKFPKV